MLERMSTCDTIESASSIQIGANACWLLSTLRRTWANVSIGGRLSYQKPRAKQKEGHWIWTTFAQSSRFLVEMSRRSHSRVIYVQEQNVFTENSADRLRSLSCGMSLNFNVWKNEGRCNRWWIKIRWEKYRQKKQRRSSFNSLFFCSLFYHLFLFSQLSFMCFNVFGGSWAFSLHISMSTACISMKHVQIV